MIAHLRGSVATVSLNSAVLDLQGVGYHVMCTPSTIADQKPLSSSMKASS